MKKLLLHSCCGPCSTHVIEVLKNKYDLTIFYSNSNIFPQEEYEKRLQEQKRYAKIMGIKVIEDEYDEEKYLEYVKGLEEEKEGGLRCKACFEFRLKRAAEYAKNNGYDLFTTTLTVSPHKNSVIINEVGQRISNEVGIEFLQESFKKQDGYKKSIELSKKYDLYRQNYCGCRFSRWFEK